MQPATANATPHEQKIIDDLQRYADEVWNAGVATPEEAMNEAIVTKLAELQRRIEILEGPNPAPEIDEMIQRYSEKTYRTPRRA